MVTAAIGLARAALGSRTALDLLGVLELLDQIGEVRGKIDKILKGNPHPHSAMEISVARELSRELDVQEKRLRRKLATIKKRRTRAKRQPRGSSGRFI